MKKKLSLILLSAAVLSNSLCAQVTSNSSVRAERMPAFIGKPAPIRPVPPPAPRPSPTPIVRPTPAPTPPPFGSSAQIQLNHQRQERNLCVPTSASIMLNKFGQNYTPRHIKTLTRGGNYNPSLPFTDFTTTTYDSLLSGLKRVGISWHLVYFSNDSKGFNEGMTRIKNSIKFGYPVMVSIALGPGNGHCVVVCGYNDRTRRITLVDPARSAPGIIEYSYEHFEIAYWNRFTSFGDNRRLAVFMYQ